MDFHPGNRVAITNDVVINGQTVFAKDEQVVIEGVSPNAERPEYKYVVTSISTGTRFQLRDSDVTPTVPTPVTAPIPQTPPTQPIKRPVPPMPKPPQKSNKKTVLIVVGIVVLFLIIVGVVASTSQKDTTETKKTPVTTTENATPTESTQPPEPTPVAQTWQTVTTVTGNTNKRTPSFHLGSGEQRILYNVTDPEGTGMVSLAVYVVNKGDSIEASGGFPEVMPDNAGPGETMLEKDEGDYYLDVTSANCSWQVTVQELK